MAIDFGGGQSLTSVITKGAVDDLGLKVGDQVTALVKASSVIVMK